MGSFKGKCISSCQVLFVVELKSVKRASKSQLQHQSESKGSTIHDLLTVSQTRNQLLGVSQSLRPSHRGAETARIPPPDVIPA